MDTQKKLHRSKSDRMISGVCGGLGEYFGVDPVLFRLILVATVLLHGSGVLLYIILMIVMPEEDAVSQTVKSNGTKPQKAEFEPLGSRDK